jgi:hypothetical protein
MELDQGAAMTQNSGTTEHESEQEDWVIPLILVLVVAFVLVVIGIFVAVRANSSEDTSPLGQAEAWTRCLRSEGVNVPLIEATGDGGFRITVDGTLIDDGVDYQALPAALSACVDEAPERIREFTERFGRFSELPFLDGALFDV